MILKLQPTLLVDRKSLALSLEAQGRRGRRRSDCDLIHSTDEVASIGRRSSLDRGIPSQGGSRSYEPGRHCLALFCSCGRGETWQSSQQRPRRCEYGVLIASAAAAAVVVEEAAGWRATRSPSSITSSLCRISYHAAFFHKHTIEDTT